MERFFLLFFLYSFLHSIYAEDNSLNINNYDRNRKILHWLNEVRKGKSLPVLKKNPILENVATKYAKQLGESGFISHIDKKGNRAIERYREAGGTAIRIGEIIGAGKNLTSVEVQWLNSSAHRRVILDPHWNNVGIGIDSVNHVYIVLFTRLFTRNLQIKTKDRNYFLITGIYDNHEKLFTNETIDKSTSPILIAGLKKYKPYVWNPETGYFCFKLKKDDYSFCRLAIIRNGDLIFTNILPNDPKLLISKDEKSHM